jgi:hypothetical protein
MKNFLPNQIVYSLVTPGKGIGVIGGGISLLAVFAVIWAFVPSLWAAIMTGVIVSAILCLVALVAMPRAMQTSIMGAALGISMDGAYAKLSDQTPVTIANALVSVAKNIAQGVGIVSEAADIAIVEKTVNAGVWAFILATAVFMLLSFLIKHDG